MRKYKDHPSLLFWSFGNELNGVWNGFLQQLSASSGLQTKARPGALPGALPQPGAQPGALPQPGAQPGAQPAARPAGAAASFDSGPCDWDERYDDLGGCWVHKGGPPKAGTACYESSSCVYSRLFSLIDEAARMAKAEADVLVVSAFADVDALYDKVERVGDDAPHLDAWTAQVYRGNTFGDFFEGMGKASSKPTLLTEYGVDAYHDVTTPTRSPHPRPRPHPHPHPNPPPSP